MSFLYPNFIYFLLPLILIIFIYIFKNKNLDKNLFSKEVMDKLRVNTNVLTHRIRNILFLLSAILIIISLAEPVIKDGTVEIKAKSSDIMIALDISDSMLAQDVYPNRLELAKQKALILLKEVPNERIGVVAFAKNSYLVSPLSFDTTAVSFLLSQLDTRSITQKGTDFLSMLEVVGDLKTSTNKKYLLILSDGGDKDDFTKEIEMAKQNDIVVFILGIGTYKGAPIKLDERGFIKQNGVILISRLNENISKLATSTGGVYIKNTISERDIMAMIGEIENVGVKKELKSQEIQKYIPLFYYPLALALFLLLVATSSISKQSSKFSNVVVILVMLFINSDVEAGILDFMKLDEAKKAYEVGDYEKSAKIYESYSIENDNVQSNYNTANSYYKQKNYAKALEFYKKVNFENKDLKANNLANMGNSYVKNGQKNSLQKAKESYESSLEIKEDKNTRENLEAVLKELEKQNQDKENQEQDKNKNENNKDKQDKEDSKDDKEQKSQDDKSEDDKSKDKDKDSKNKKEEDKKNKDSKSKKDEDKKDKEVNEKEENEDSKSKKDKSENENKEETKGQMSDEEQQKWLNKLNSQQKSYLYKLNKQNQNEVDLDEKPW